MKMQLFNNVVNVLEKGVKYIGILLTIQVAFCIIYKVLKWELMSATSFENLIMATKYIILGWSTMIIGLAICLVIEWMACRK